MNLELVHFHRREIFDLFHGIQDSLQCLKSQLLANQSKINSDVITMMNFLLCKYNLSIPVFILFHPQLQLNSVLISILNEYVFTAWINCLKVNAEKQNEMRSKMNFKTCPSFYIFIQLQCILINPLIYNTSNNNLKYARSEPLESEDESKEIAARKLKVSNCVSSNLYSWNSSSWKYIHLKNVFKNMDAFQQSFISNMIDSFLFFLSFYIKSNEELVQESYLESMVYTLNVIDSSICGSTIH